MYRMLQPEGCLDLYVSFGFSPLSSLIRYVLYLYNRLGEWPRSPLLRRVHNAARSQAHSREFELRVSFVASRKTEYNFVTVSHWIYFF